MFPTNIIQCICKLFIDDFYLIVDPEESRRHCRICQLLYVNKLSRLIKLGKKNSFFNRN